MGNENYSVAVNVRGYTKSRLHTPGRPVERTRVLSKPVIVTMIPELLAIGIDQPRMIASGERVFSDQWEQTRVPDL